MKKKTIIFQVLLAMFSSVLCGSCSFETRLAPPTVTAYGQVLTWEEVENATSYLIYQNDALVATTHSLFWIPEEITLLASEFAVVSHNDNDEKYTDSRFSDTVTLYQTAGFDSAVTQTITLEDNRTYHIEETIMYVHVSGTGVNSNIIIENRASQMVIDLDTVSLQASGGESCITTSDGSYSYDDHTWMTVIRVLGTNVLQGGFVTERPAQPAADKEITGTNGVNGGHAIALPKIFFTGTGTLSCRGGDGGPGGKGSNATTWFNGTFGRGGNGGNGGTGIRCEEAILGMQSSGVLTVKGGQGGVRGDAGDNGSIVTGIIGVAFWESCCGSAGTAGRAIVGSLTEYRGTYSLA